MKRLLEERGIKVNGVAKARHAQEGTAGDPAVLAEHVFGTLGDAGRLITRSARTCTRKCCCGRLARQSGVWATRTS